MSAIASTRPGPGLGGLEVGDAHPLDAVDGGQLGQQGLEQPQVAEVLAVGRGVLADEEQLLDALRRPATGPRRATSLGPAADERAAEARDRAEGAAAVAAAGQLERRHRAAVEPAAYGARAGRGRTGTDLGQSALTSWPGTEIVEASRSTGVMGSSRRRSGGVCGRGAPRPPTIDAQPGGDVGVVVEAEHRVGLGQRLGEVLAVALGQAADGHDGLARPPVLGP